MRDALSRVGLDARFEENGHDALGCFLTQRPELVITAARLPEMDGMVLTKTMRTLPGCETLPILMVTETETLTDDDIERAYRCGITDIVQNPRNWTLFSYRISYLMRANNAEQELSVAHDYMRKAIDLFPGGFLIYDSQDRLMLANRNAREKMPGLHLGMTPRDAWRYAYRSGAFVTRGQGEAEWIQDKVNHMNAEGWWEINLQGGRCLRLHSARLEDGSRFAISLDITEQRQNERKLLAARQEAEDANRIKAQFLSGMSHEIRTPLNAIIGFSDIIRREMMGKIDNPAYVDYAADINTSANHLLETLTLILDISKVETASTILVEEEFDLSGTLGKARRKFAGIADAKTIAIECEPSPEILVLGDETRMLRAVNCIVDNAVKFSPPRSTVRMGTRVAAGAVELWVRDEGIGMTSADLPQAFKLFSQLDDATDRRFSGMGIGLAYAKTVIEAHGGSVLMDTTLNRGTLVTLSLPLSRLAESPPEIRDRPSRMTG